MNSNAPLTGWDSQKQDKQEAMNVGTIPTAAP